MDHKHSMPSWPLNIRSAVGLRSLFWLQTNNTHVRPASLAPRPRWLESPVNLTLFKTHPHLEFFNN